MNENAVTSPRRRSERRSWSAAPENPPDLIANGMRGNSVEVDLMCISVIVDMLVLARTCLVLV